MTDRTSADHDCPPPLSALAEAQAELDQYGPEAPGAQERVQAFTPRPLQPTDRAAPRRAHGCDV